MKRWLRSPTVQALLGRLAAAYGEWIIATLRWRIEGLESFNEALAAKRGFLALFWHGRIAHAIACRPLLGDTPRGVMVSLSRDGQFIALAAERLRVPTIRGSAAPSGGGSDKGGAAALMAGAQIVRSGGGMLVTPDGPRGPAHVIQMGTLHLARMGGGSTFLMGLAATPSLAMGSWDDGRLPLPFGRAALVLEGPLPPPKTRDADGLERIRTDWEARMRAIQTRAEALIAADARPLALDLYARATGGLAPLAPLILRARARRGKEDAVRLDERLGRASRPRPEGRIVWLHGVSVGESVSLLPLAERFASERSDWTVLITSGTAVSAEVLSGRLPSGAIHQYAPVDTPDAAGRFLAHWRPDLGILVESDLWPNLILGARARGTRLVLVSARLSARSAARWKRAPASIRALLGAFDRILARDEASADRLRGLGAKVDGIADLKFGAAPLAADDWALSEAKGALNGRPVILAASTHPGEEQIILRSFADARAAGRRRPALIIAPRHPNRGAAIAALASAMGLLTGRRGDGGRLEGVDVYVADTVGEMGLWYRLASLAIVGGSLTASGGGHNPLEPARLDCPFVSGAFTQDWPVYERLATAGATRIVEPRQLGDLITETLQAPSVHDDMAKRARAFVTAGDQQTLSEVSRLIDLATW